jgi:hypothetical protein
MHNPSAKFLRLIRKSLLEARSGACYVIDLEADT